MKQLAIVVGFGSFCLLVYLASLAIPETEGLKAVSRASEILR
jgi:hypothetical protein